MNYRAYLILRERLRKNWSQEGLCKGICTVSYLSKIESGKAEPSGEIMNLLLWLPYPLMLANRGLCGFLGSNSAIVRNAAVQRYIPSNLRSRVNAFNNVLLTAGASVFSLLMGALGELLDYRWCLTVGGAIAMLASWLLIWGRRKDVRKVYEQSAE